MDFELIVAMTMAALASGWLVFLLVRSASVAPEEGKLGTGVRSLLALPAAYVARRRVLDRELSRKLDDLDRLRVQAGCRYLEGATAPEIFVARFVFPALAVIFFTAIGMILRLPGGIVMLLVAFFGILLYAWPETGLKAAARERSVQFTHELPMALDVMRLVCQSGGDLHGAIESTIGVIGASPVREELVRAVHEVAIGTSLAKALSNIGDRVGTAEANAVFSTLSQALEMGTSVSENLQSASQLIRHTQRIKAQAKAQKAVVAMTFPLLLLILPGVFVVLFAPLVIQHMNK